jgi:hypothetical protein
MAESGLIKPGIRLPLTALNPVFHPQVKKALNPTVFQFDL